MRSQLSLALIPLALILLIALAPVWAAADYPNWQALEDVAVIEVITEDEDGDLRESKVWFVLVDREPYLRTNGSRWLENLRRDSNLALRIEDTEYSARAVEVAGDEILKRVDEASREKYGWQESMIHPFRMKKPEVLLITPRDEAN
jgi:hypothetical protein